MFLDRGMIALMFGPPGVGKTFTTEASKYKTHPQLQTGWMRLLTKSLQVAERAHVALYSMTAGKLGTNPQAVASLLDRALEL